MLQIIVGVVGLLALIKGEIKFTRTRVVTATTARILGAVLLAAAGLPLILPRGFGTMAMLAAFLIVFVLAGVLSKQVGQHERSEPTGR